MNPNDVPNGDSGARRRKAQTARPEIDYPDSTSDTDRETAFVTERERPDEIAKDDRDGTSTTKVPTAKKTKGNRKHQKRSRPLAESTSDRSSVHLSEDAADDGQLEEETSHISEVEVEFTRNDTLPRRRPERRRSQHAGPKI